MPQVVESTHLRPTVSRFGGMIQEGNAVAIPNQTWDQNAPLWGSPHDFATRHRPSLEVYGAGVPGYTGYKPHGSSPVQAGGLMKPHSPTYAAHDPSLQPQAMPVVGYSGHVRSTKDSNASFGTSHWKPAAAPGVPMVGAAATMAGGTHVDGYWVDQDLDDDGVIDEEFIKERREMEEANELLELRSMGIRAALKNSLPARLSKYSTTPF